MKRNPINTQIHVPFIYVTHKFDLVDNPSTKIQGILQEDHNKDTGNPKKKDYSTRAKSQLSLIFIIHTTTNAMQLST